jgi:hypothetical protein
MVDEKNLNAWFSKPHNNLSTPVFNIYASENHSRILQRQFDDGSCFKTVFQSGTNCPLHRSVEKKINGEENEHILFDPKNNSPKIVWSSL